MIGLLEKVSVEQIPEVETAKALMNEAASWSVMKWLREKKRVRKAADQANAALDQMNQGIKERWNDGLRAAYQALVASADAPGTRSRPKSPSQPIAREASLLAMKVKDADDEAFRARMDAEETFDAAERQLSTSLAREGCRKAILSWDLHEKAIRKAEAAIRLK